MQRHLALIEMRGPARTKHPVQAKDVTPTVNGQRRNVPVLIIFSFEAVRNSALNADCHVPKRQSLPPLTG